MRKLLAISVTLALFAAGGMLFAASAGAPITVLAWGAAGSSGDPVEKIFVQVTDDFNKAQKGAQVNLQWIANNNYYEKLNTMIAAGSVPDLYTVHAAGKLGDYVSSAKAVPFDQYLNADAAWKGSFLGGAFDLLSYSGKAYGIPWYSAVVPLYYNKALFAQYKLDPPATWNAFTKAIKTLNDHNIAPIAMCAAGANGAWVPALFMEVLVERMGGVAPYQQILDRKGDWSFVNPTFVKAGQMMQQLIGMKAFNSDFLALDADGIASMFKTNAAGMYLMGSWAVSQFNTPDSKLGADVGVVNFPGITGGTGDPNIWLGQPSVNMAMGPNNKNVPLSIAYLKAWTGTVAEKALAEVAGQIPTTRVTLDVSKVPPVFAATNDLLKKMKSMYIFYDVGLGTALGNEWNNAVVNICAGKDVTQSLQTLQNYAKSNQ